jgi:hypothetical protein
LLQAAQARALPPQRHEAPPAPEGVYPPAAPPPRRVHRRLYPWQRWLRRVVLGE